MKVSSGAQMKVKGKRFGASTGSGSLKDPMGKPESCKSACKIKHDPKDSCISCDLNISKYIDLTMDTDDQVPIATTLDPKTRPKLDSVTKQDTKIATKSDITVDLGYDTESEIEFDLNPDLKSTGTEIKPESNKYPKCEPGSSILPFSLSYEEISAHWTDPDRATCQRKNNCTVMLGDSSEERTAVVDNFLQSLREGSEKLEKERSKHIDSAAGDCFYCLCSFRNMKYYNTIAMKFTSYYNLLTVRWINT
jgi:hypothetical protein